MARSHSFLVDDPAFDQHIPLAYHPERPERLVAARAAVQAADVAWEPINVAAATEEQLVRVHTPRFVEELRLLRGKQTMIDADTYVSAHSVDAALRAAGGGVHLVDAILDGKIAGNQAPISTGVALLRPPGHHARIDAAMGFCLLNNVAIAAAHARSRGIERIAIIDFDVHHGNGTQEIFYRDPNVLYLSAHQWPFYPGSGSAGEVGEGEGKGFTVNVPISAGAGDAVYRAAFERLIGPILETFAPQLILVSAGYDAAARDPLAEMRLTASAFGFMTSVLAKQADRSADGRIALFLEGGYDLPSLESGLAASIAGLLKQTSFEDLSERMSVAPGMIVPAHEADLARAQRVAERRWKLG